MNYLVTGSTGFLGSSLVSFLEKKGNTVYQCGRNINIKNQLYFDLEKKINLQNEILKKTNILIHCAYSFYASSLENSRKINVLGSKEIFKLASKHNIKIIYISSISAFENCSSVHGKVKLEIEYIAKKYNASIIRPGLIYSNKIQGAMFGSLINLVKKIPIIPLINNGNQILYMCRLEILCDLIHKVSLQKNTINNIITAANKEPVMFKEIIKMIAAKYNKQKILIPFPSIIIIFMLKIAESLNIKLRLQSDSLVSILKPNANPSFTNLNNYNISFPSFKSDFK